MYAGKESCRGMVYIIFLVMIITLSTVLANPHVCDRAFETMDGGYSSMKGKAVCINGAGTFICDIDACKSGSPNGPAGREQFFLAVIKVYTCLTYLILVS
ncbi:hypothetical protein MJO28_010555 [Puccinia striiformis f. sp. tritici]|uniref:Uncharacterized protein n=1 Tax=Puccinia striiformis f. sp. tritici TaxID=168172 RepID=A0ACC0E704_9BASI|nr:hypothetical protein MJO28_010555 [Puccinia striiformis f. sp. tritici]